MRVIGEREVAGRLDWAGAVAALRAGHTAARAGIGDLFLGPADATLLTRAAHVPGLGYGVKAVTVVDGNPARGLPTVQGAMLVFHPGDGRLAAIVDSQVVTAWKTAADSVLGATLLARPDSRELLVVGAGAVAATLVEAYAALFDLARIRVWSRRPGQAQALAARVRPPGVEIAAVADLPAAVATADIVATATMARSPVLRGAWVRPGTHVDLIGAYKADMREADDALIAGGRLFVDSRESTLGHIGEICIPLAAGVLEPDDIRGDLYDLVGGAPGRISADDVTLFKNGGGAHLDLMIARWIAGAVPG